ncbi:4-Cys prefix domain-containing protein [Microseira sp. BLCC-F43]|uniref:4-Cys prefix domain-containing protein n=1 Tax=Microseira sp. BLCC-F43 TaxID=3153602 RepID=UPI0035B6FCF8
MFIISYCLNPQCQKPRNPDGTKFCQSCGSRLLLGLRYRPLNRSCPLRGNFRWPKPLLCFTHSHFASKLCSYVRLAICLPSPGRTHRICFTMGFKITSAEIPAT